LTPRWALTAALAAALVTGCSVSDGPGEPIEDPGAIPDAVPRDEPLSESGNPESYEVRGERYHVMDSAAGFRERGIGSWYGSKFQGRQTASGERFDMYAMTAAHKRLPLPTYLRVKNLDNGRTIVVRVNDRGPFADNRILDLSYAAAAKIGMLKSGTAPVSIRAVGPGTAATGDVAESSAEAGSTSYYLQLGAFRSRRNARALVRQAERADLERAIRIRQPSNDPLYRVQIGPFSNADAVDRATRSLKVIGLRDSHVVVRQ